MPDTDRRCGTCKWLDRAETYNSGNVTPNAYQCIYPVDMAVLPSSIDVMIMYEYEGTKCPCWLQEQAQTTLEPSPQ